MAEGKSCVLAFSGGLDTSAIVPWLNERGYTVHALAVDVGQHEDWGAVEKRAHQLGAASFRVRRAVDEMASRLLKPAIGLASTYEGMYRLGTALARPVIALEQVRLARELGCTALAHGATGKGNDQVRFEYAYRTLAPECEVIAPWKTWSFSGRADLANYLEQQGYDFEFEINKTYSLDENLWHTSIEGGALEDPAAVLDVPSIIHDVLGAASGDEVAPIVQLTFDKGEVVACDGVPVKLTQLVDVLNQRYRHAPWGHDLVVENRFTGVKSRGIYVNPAARLLHDAADALARATMAKPAYDLWAELGTRYAEMLYRGEYFSQQRKVFDAAASAAMTPLTGSVTLKTTPTLHVAAIDAPESLFREEIATFEASDWSHEKAAGFIELSWLGNVGPLADHEVDASAAATDGESDDAFAVEARRHATPGI